MTDRITQAREALKTSRKYILGAYEWTFPHEDENEAALRSVDEAIAALESAAPSAAEPAARWSNRKFYDKRQQNWCEYYERTTGFEPLMCDYEAGNETFVEAAEKSNQWYEDHTTDTYLAITRWIPGSEYDTGESYGD